MWIILTRNPSNGHILAMEDDDGNIIPYKTDTDAYSAAYKSNLCNAWGFEVLEVDFTK